jgi:ATP sulfurylase
VRYHTYEVLKREIDNPNIRWAYLPYSMHMAGPREAIQHMIIRKNYGAWTGSVLAMQCASYYLRQQSQHEPQ